MSMSPGIIAAGNWIVDITKMINVYPAQDTLADIASEVRNNGGGAFNLLCDLAAMGAPFPMQALGLLGEDSGGDWIVAHCVSLGIDSSLLCRHATAPTSYTDVMTVSGTGRRTFFHQRGANAFFGPEHFPWDRLTGKILYLGYLLLLDTLDAPDPRYGTVATRVLAEAGQRGLYRAVDLVSVERPDYSAVVNFALPEIDLLICNELEASRVTGIATRGSDDTLLGTGVKNAAAELLRRGVKDRVVIHFPEGAYAASLSGETTWQGRVRLPEHLITGAAGAGDAFAAGLLYGLHEEMAMSQNLRNGVCAAAACLRSATTSAGIGSLEECLALGETYGHLELSPA
jgi:sugar/nucleoside kinase (ribokinase family)